MAEVSINVYNGNEYNNIKTWAPLPSSTTSMDDVMAEFGTSPEVMPKAPHIDDLPNVPTFDGDYSPVAEVSDMDLPF